MSHLLVALALALGAGAPPGPAFSTPARHLTAVEILGVTPAVVVRLAGDGELRYSTMRLDQPPRVVFDFAGVVAPSPWPRIAVDGDPVTRIRVGQLRTRPEPVTRVVFDLRHWSLPRVETLDGALILTFEPPPPPPPRASLASAELPALLFPKPWLTLEPSEPLLSAAVEAPDAAAMSLTTSTLAPPVPAPPSIPVSGAPPSTLVLPHGRLITTLQLDGLSPGGDGGAAAVDWLGPLDSRTTLLAGAAHQRLDRSHWSFAKLGVLFRVDERLNVSGQIHGGGGERGDGEDFEYRIAQLETHVTLIPKRFYLRLENRYLDVDRTRGNLLGGGLTVLPGSDLSLALSYLRSTGSGTLDAEYLSGRIDSGHRRLRWLAGFALGRSQTEILGLVGADGAVVDLEQVFAGIVLPFWGGELTLVLDHIDLEVAERNTLSLSLSLPQGGRRNLP